MFKYCLFYLTTDWLFVGPSIFFAHRLNYSLRNERAGEYTRAHNIRQRFRVSADYTLLIIFNFLIDATYILSIYFCCFAGLSDIHFCFLWLDLYLPLHFLSFQTFTYRDFDQLALDILDQCFERDSAMTQALIRRTLDQRFRHKSCIQLAETAQSRKILSHKCCVIVVDEIWNGIISPESSIIWVYISSLSDQSLVLWSFINRLH